MRNAVIFVLALVLPLPATAAMCTGEYNHVKGIEHAIGSTGARIGQLNNQIAQGEAARSGPLAAAHAEASRVLNTSKSSAANREASLRVIDEIIPLMQKFALSGKRAEQLEGRLKDLMAARPELSLAAAFDVLISRSKSKLSRQEAEELTRLAVLLDVLEKSYEDWLKASEALIGQALAQGVSFTAVLAQDLIELRASTLAVAQQENALIESYTAKVADLEKQIADWLTVEAQSRAELAAQHERLAALQRNLPGAQRALEICSELAAYKWDRAPK